MKKKTLRWEDLELDVDFATDKPKEKIISESAGSVSCEAHRPDIEKLKEEFYQQMKDGITFCAQTNSYLINQSLWNWFETTIKNLKVR